MFKLKQRGSVLTKDLTKSEEPSVPSLQCTNSCVWNEWKIQCHSHTRYVNCYQGNGKKKSWKKFLPFKAAFCKVWCAWPQGKLFLPVITTAISGSGALWACHTKILTFQLLRLYTKYWCSFVKLHKILLFIHFLVQLQESLLSHV